MKLCVYVEETDVDGIMSSWKIGHKFELIFLHAYMYLLLI